MFIVLLIIPTQWFNYEKFLCIETTTNEETQHTDIKTHIVSWKTTHQESLHIGTTQTNTGMTHTHRHTSHNQIGCAINVNKI